MTVVRVLHVLEAARGGTSRHLVDIMRNAAGVEHHVVVPPPRLEPLDSGAAYDATGIEHIQAAGGHVHLVNMRRTPTHPANLVAVIQLRWLIRQIQPSLVHAHSSIGGAVARMATVTHGVPIVYTPHALAAGKLAQAIERTLSPRTTRLVAVSESEADTFRTLRLVPARRIAVIPNGIDLTPIGPASIDLRSSLELPASTPLVGSVARLVAQKAPEELVALCAAVGRHRPDAHFLHIGMGPLQDQVDSAVAKSGIATRWHQIRELPDAAATLNQLDVFVLPSRFEGGPYAPLEAMRAGTPVVLSDVVGNRDIVEDGVSGFLVAFGDTEKMAARVISLLEEPDRRQAIVAAARERLRTGFDVRVMGARLSELYREVAGESRRR